MLHRILLTLALLFPALVQAQELPEGQGPTEYESWLAEGGPGRRASVLSFESWQQAAGVHGVLPHWQTLRTASMWRECGGQPFEVPPPAFWPDMTRTLKFIRDHVRPTVGPVEAVSGYRNPALNGCARGSQRSAHLDFFALDLIPLQPLTRRQLFERVCPLHAARGPAAEVGLGFYTFTRFHIDTRGFRRWGSAGPQGNESPCAVLARGEDPEAPPVAQAAPQPAATPLPGPPVEPPNPAPARPDPQP